MAPTLPKNFTKHVVQAIRAFCPLRNTMMHSHIGPKKAFQIAREKGLKTVEQTILDAIGDDIKHKKYIYKDTLQVYNISRMEFVKRGGDIEEWKAAWNEISRVWAEHAMHETLLATTKRGPGPKSFYRRIEEPILKKRNIKITVDDSYPPWVDE
ncbi:hypothetical protein E4U55_008120 [Claviceps digitariae]|nr:hypothetical protein E4U55_008120 [Claviceps digitariae]